MVIPLFITLFFSAYAATRFIVCALNSYHFYNCDHITPAYIAAIKGDVRMLQIFNKFKVLLNELIYNGCSPFHFAILHGNLDAAKFILEESGKSIINSLVNGSPLTNSKLCFEYFSPLDIAQTTKNQQVIDFLLSNNAYP